MPNQYRSGDPTTIKHAGVKGMRWGVRRERPKSLSGGTKRAPDSPTDELSTAQLQARIERMRLQRDYRSLQAELKRRPPTRAQQFIERAVIDGVTAGGKKVIENATTRLGNEVVKYMLGEITSVPTAKKVLSGTTSVSAPPAQKAVATEHQQATTPTLSNKKSFDPHVSLPVVSSTSKPLASQRHSQTLRGRASRPHVNGRLNRRRFGR